METYGCRASGARFELLKPYARSAYIRSISLKLASSIHCNRKRHILGSSVKKVNRKIDRSGECLGENTWFAKSATECMTSASITWLELTNQTPNLRENTRKLHHNAVVTARCLENINICIKQKKEQKRERLTSEKYTAWPNICYFAQGACLALSNNIG